MIPKLITQSFVLRKIYWTAPILRSLAFIQVEHGASINTKRIH